MQRRKFIKNSCLACIGGFAFSEMLLSCGINKHHNATIVGDEIVIPLSDFKINKNGKIEYKRYIISQHENLKYPICIYRNSATNFNALWMMCPHQGAELQVFGDKLQCPAHGSEFNTTGKVESAPATENLKTFPIRLENNQLKISLK